MARKPIGRTRSVTVRLPSTWVAVIEKKADDLDVTIADIISDAIRDAIKDELYAICSGCGYTNDPAAKFCNQCGAALAPDDRGMDHRIEEYIRSHPDDVRKILQE